MKIPEPRGEGEARPWTTGTKKARWKRLPSVGLAPAHAGTAPNSDDFPGPAVSPAGKGKPKADMQLPQCWGVSREFQLVATSQESLGKSVELGHLVSAPKWRSARPTTSGVQI